MNKVVLAYSGGLDTSVAVAWLKEQYGVEVITLTVDVGGGSLRDGVERRAMSAGASRAYVVDARERFITDFVWPHLQANALYQGAYPLATALARPLIAQLLVEVANREGADATHLEQAAPRNGLRAERSAHELSPAEGELRRGWLIAYPNATGECDGKTPECARPGCNRGLWCWYDLTRPADPPQAIAAAARAGADSRFRVVPRQLAGGGAAGAVTWRTMPRRAQR